MYVMIIYGNYEVDEFDHVCSGDLEIIIGTSRLRVGLVLTLLFLYIIGVTGAIP